MTLSGPDEQRRLKETDIDPAGEFASDHTGETENPGSGSGRETNQPAESRENPERSDNRQSENRDSEHAPKPGHEE